METPTATLWHETPLMYSKPLSQAAGCQIYLKLENLQPSGSFKSRGVGNFLLDHAKRSITGGQEHRHGDPHFYCSSGGNAGLACVTAAVTLGLSATIVVPVSTSQYMMNKIKDAGAYSVFQIGSSWVDADTHLRDVVIPDAQRRGENAVYVPPFDAQAIWDGNATIVDELKRQTGDDSSPLSVRAIVCSVGGGGLFCGIAQRINEQASGNKPHIITVETQGAESLAASIEAKRHVTLPAITSIATTLGATRVAEKAYAYAQEPHVTTVVLHDRDAVFGCVQLADLHRMLVETSCGVAVAMCFDGRLQNIMKDLKESDKVIIVVCGGSNVTLDLLNEYRQSYLLHCNGTT